MFERFHQDARRAVARAVSEAVSARQDQIGCEYLLFGLLAEPGIAAQALTDAGLEITSLRAQLPGGGSTADPDSLDADALASLGIDLDAVRRATDAAFGHGALDRARAPRRDRLRITGGRALTADTKKSLELALRAAVGLHNNYISSGHVLIGILSQEDNAALAALRAAGIDTGALRADVVRRMTAAA
jgi:ATP-dependent Clp protease ATP-binding subunit ClpA